MNVGSLCSGYGGLELAALELWPDTSAAWHAEIDPHASTVLAAHWPDVPNLGNLSAADWTEVEPVDVLTAGYPCQPFSTAGRRKGEDDARHLWPGVLRAVRDLRPRLVLLENVAGHLSLGFGRVLGDLAEVGYVGSWTCLRASDVGAPHRRDRVFVAAHPADAERGGWDGRTGTPGPRRGTEPPPHGGDAVADTFGGAAQLRRGPRPVARPPRPPESEGHQRQRGGHPAGGGGQAPADAASVCGSNGTICCGEAGQHEWTVALAGGGDRRRDTPSGGGELGGAAAELASFGAYQPAIDQWATTLGRPAPPALNDRHLNARFVEWMMGLPDGWVTDLVPRRHALRILGNGVVPQQAAEAYRNLLAVGR